MGTQCVLPSPLRSSMAHPTLAGATGSVVGVNQIVGMSLRAMCLDRMASGYTFAPQDVYAHRDNFKVSRVHANAVPTEMVDSQTIGDGVDQQLVSKTVSIECLAAEMEFSITAPDSATQPWPTGIGAAGNIDFAPEPFAWRLKFAGVYSLWHRKVTPFGVHAAGRSRVAAASILP